MSDPSTDYTCDACGSIVPPGGANVPALLERIAALKTERTSLIEQLGLMGKLDMQQEQEIIALKARAEQAEREKEELRLKLITAVVNEEKAHAQTKHELAEEQARLLDLRSRLLEFGWILCSDGSLTVASVEQKSAERAAIDAARRAE